MFTVFDNKAEIYLKPFYEQSIGVAVRNFGDTADDEQSQLNKHSSDFELMHIGVYDDQNCIFDIFEHRKQLGTAADHKTKFQTPELVQTEKKA